MPAYCPQKSKYRMVILLKNGNDHLKKADNNGTLSNPVWYSFLSKDKYQDTLLKMVDRFKRKSTYYPYTQVIMVFDNQNRAEPALYKEIL